MSIQLIWRMKRKMEIPKWKKRCRQPSNRKRLGAQGHILKRLANWELYRVRHANLELIFEPISFFY
jgi:hypothetical protein